MKNTELELFEAYFYNELDEPSRASFEERLNTNKDLKERFEQFSLSVTLVEFEGLRKEISKIHVQEKPQVKKIGSNKYYNWAAAATFILLLTATTFWFNNKSNTNELFIAHFDPYPNIVTIRGNDINDAMIKYSNEQYSESAQLLEQVKKITDTTFLYLLISKAAISEEIQIPNFEDQLQGFAISSSLTQQLRWYAGLYYIKIGEQSRSITYLRMIQKDDFKYLEAQEIIESLE